MSELDRAGVTIDIKKLSTQLTAQAEQVWDRMLTLKVEPNMIVCTSMVALYARLGCFQKAVDLFHQITSVYGLECDLKAWGSLIYCHVLSGQTAAALAALEKMIEEGICPDMRSYTMLILGYAKERNVDCAEAAFKRMQDEQVATRHARSQASLSHGITHTSTELSPTH